MKVVILAGGEGTRLRPITYEIPKPLFPVKRKAVISHIIDFFNKYGASEIGIIIERRQKKDFDNWKKFLKNKQKSKIKFFIENKRGGTFGCLRIVKNWIKKDSFIVANGDCLVDFDLNKLMRFHNKYKPIVSVPILKVNTSGNYGIVEMNDNFVKKFKRENIIAGEFISGGPYIFQPKIFDYDESSKKFINIESGIFLKLIKDNKIMGIKIRKSRFFDCGTFDSLEKAIKNW
ncbi:MAG: nucleotidyltransferase family protein [Patescibacteria group bacterium]